MIQSYTSFILPIKTNQGIKKKNWFFKFFGSVLNTDYAHIPYLCLFYPLRHEGLLHTKGLHRF